MSKNKVIYFYAPSWDRNAMSKMYALKDECRKLGLDFSAIDVESKKGVEMSIELAVKNVPTAVIRTGSKIVGVEKGNKIHEIIAKYS